MAEVRWYLLACILVFWPLAGCGGVSEDVPDQPPLTFEPVPTLFAEGSCENIEDLESWLQTVGLRYREFDEFLDNASDQSRRQIYENVARMGRIAVIIAELPAPDCAVDTHALMHDAMQFTANRFQEYVNGDAENLNAIVDQAQVQFAPALNEYNILLEELDARYRQSN